MTTGAAITNCTITSNSAGNDGGGIYWEDGTSPITHCTIAGNSVRSWGKGGGVYWKRGSAAITNCILWGDKPEEIYVRTGNPLVTYCDVEGGWEGEGNINADPRFVEGPLGEVYLSHKKAGQKKNSPCANKGNGKAKDLGIKKTTTRTAGKKDTKKVDMGYHYPR